MCWVIAAVCVGFVCTLIWFVVLRVCCGVLVYWFVWVCWLVCFVGFGLLAGVLIGGLFDWSWCFEFLFCVVDYAVACLWLLR